MTKILLANLFKKESIIKLLFDLDPIEQLILFVDKDKLDFQKQNLEYLKAITETKKIKVKEIEIDDVYNFESIVEVFHKTISKYPKEELYFDVSHSKRTLGFALITYLSIKYPSNLKKVYAYSSSENLQMEVPIFKAQELSEKEIKTIEFVESNSKFFQRDLADFLQVSIQHAGRLLDDLIKNNLIDKAIDYQLTQKGHVFLIANSKGGKK